MKNSMHRFYKRNQVVLHCETLTPMFLGNAHQEAEWRAAPFKALLRYWWRVMKHGLSKSELKDQEGQIFGAAGEKESSQKSLLDIQVVPHADAKPVKKAMPKMEAVEHPECERQRFRVDPLLYLAGMGLVNFKTGPNHTFFDTGCFFDLRLAYPGQFDSEIKALLGLIKAFGAVGARSRNGWGSFQILSADGIDFEQSKMVESMNRRLTHYWANGFDHDYPNCLGKDKRGPLLWKTAPQKEWHHVMRDLADVYIHVRAKTVSKIPRLNPGKVGPEERHLLGVPLTNHKAWGNSARHASPLRFVVHKHHGDFQGYILHLPHAHSTDMRLPAHIDPLKVWEKVHIKLDGLDTLLNRATYEECLS